MAHSVHLLQRNGTFYFRVRIPADLKHHFQRNELKKSLRTKSLTSARRMVKLWGGRTEHIFTLMRSGMLTNTQIKQLVEDYIAFALEQNDAERLEAGTDHTEVVENDDRLIRVSSRALFNPEQEQVVEDLENNSYGYVSKRLDEFLSEVNLEVDKESIQYKQLCRDIALAHIQKIHDIDCQRDMGDYSDPYYLKEWKHPATQPAVLSTPPTVHTQPSHRLSDAIERFIADKKTKGLTEGALKQYEGTCSRFTWILGDRDITSYTKDDLRTFVETIKNLPAGFNTRKQFRDMSFKELLAVRHEELLTPKTVNGHISLLKAIFSWAENEDWITSNPSKVIKYVNEKKGKGKAKVRYTKADLQKLTDSFHAEAKSGGLPRNKAERFWIPLIAMFSGMRLNEICQLQITDVKQCDENGHWYIDVNEQEGVTSVKTSAGIRQVPIHPSLIELGFIDYFKKIKTSGADRVWPNLTKTQRGYKRRFDNWFNGTSAKAGFNRRHVTEDPKKTFHSTRHSFRDELKQLRVDSDVSAEIVGHEYEEGEAGTYTDDYLLQIKLEALQQVTYGLDLKHLKPLADQYL